MNGTDDEVMVVVLGLRSQACDDMPAMYDLLGEYAFDKLIGPDELPVTLDQVQLEEDFIKY